MFLPDVWMPLRLPDEDREELTVSYNEIIKDLLEEDRHAE